MKKVLVAAAITAAVLLGAVAYAEIAAINGTYEGYPIVRVTVDGKPVQTTVPAINFKGSTLVPLRAALEAAGLTVSWDEATWTANVTNPLKARVEELEAQLADLHPSQAVTSPVALPEFSYGQNVQHEGLTVTVKGIRDITGAEAEAYTLGITCVLALDFTVDNATAYPVPVGDIRFEFATGDSSADRLLNNMGYDTTGIAGPWFSPGLTDATQKRALTWTPTVNSVTLYHKGVPVATFIQGR